MEVSFLQLCQKSVISIQNGCDFCGICDIIIDGQNHSLISIVMRGRLRLFGLLGRCPDIVVPVKNIKNIGRDVILVDFLPPQPEKSQNNSIFGRFF